jgi:hypothetical protein
LFHHHQPEIDFDSKAMRNRVTLSTVAAVFGHPSKWGLTACFTGCLSSVA